MRGGVTLVVVGADYYYSCMCSLCARIYFSLHVGSEGELVSYVSRLLVCIKVLYFCTLCWCVFVKFVAKRGRTVFVLVCVLWCVAVYVLRYAGV